MNKKIDQIRIIDAEKDFFGAVEIADEKIFRVEKIAEKSPPDAKILFPGLWDVHVHFRDPGLTHKEDFETGSKSAVAGGVTTVFDMPNTIPPVFSAEILEQKRALVGQKSYCNFGLYFGAGPKNDAEILKAKNIPGVKMYLNTTTGDLKMDDEHRWAEVFKLGRRVALHAEGNTFTRAVHVWKNTGAPCPLHLCHASLEAEVGLVRELKNDEKCREKISMEACPHHLLMTAKDRETHGAYCCMKPELATEKDREALWQGIQDGTVDILATDHAPHTKAEKQEADAGGKPCFGIPGVEILFPLMFTQWQHHGWDTKKLVAMMTTKPRQIFDVKSKKGLIKEEWDADLTLWNPEDSGKECGIVSAENQHSKCRWTPYEGYKVCGNIEKTWVNGHLTFDVGKFSAENYGKELTF